MPRKPPAMSFMAGTEPRTPQRRVLVRVRVVLAGYDTARRKLQAMQAPYAIIDALDVRTFSAIAAILRGEGTC